MPKRMKFAIVLSSLFFWFFISFAVYFWIQNRAVKMTANQQYAAMLDVAQVCQNAESTADSNCIKMKQARIALDKSIQSSGHYSALTRLFITFAFFLTLLTWASYFLNRAIFH